MNMDYDDYDNDNIEFDDPPEETGEDSQPRSKGRRTFSILLIIFAVTICIALSVAGILAKQAYDKAVAPINAVGTQAAELCVREGRIAELGCARRELGAVDTHAGHGCRPDDKQAQRHVPQRAGKDQP